MSKIITFFIILFLAFYANAKLIKVSNSGKLLENNSSQWNCVFDDKTELIWEVKTDKQGLQNKNNTYTWFEDESGEQNGKYSNSCDWGSNCNSKKYIIELNKTGLCNSSNWRLPTEKELSSLLFYSDYNPLINTDYFPNTQAKYYWSSTSHNKNPSVAIDIPFFYGGKRGSDKSFNSHIRGVAKFKQ
jgi:hypothetical protein